jgi:hypothetical protein
MGLRDAGDDPVTLAQTGCPCARVQGSGPDGVALVVPSGTGIEAQFALVGMRALARDLTMQVHCAQSKDAKEQGRKGCCQPRPRGLIGCLVPARSTIATMRLICTVPSSADELG